MAQATATGARRFYPVDQRLHKLAGVKQALYHPALPTFRRMHRHDMLHKLPDEHCRTTTALTKDDFSKLITNRGPGINYKCTSQELQKRISTYQPVEIGTSYTENWNKTMSKLDMGLEKRCNDPQINATWHHYRPVTVMVQNKVCKPLPAMTLSQYRIPAISNTRGWKSPWK